MSLIVFITITMTLSTSHCRAIKLTGPFVTMIFSMITGDMFTFSIIYVIFLFGFSQAFHFMMKSTDEESMYAGYMTTWIALFHMTLGEYEVGGYIS